MPEFTADFQTSYAARQQRAGAVAGGLGRRGVGEEHKAAAAHPPPRRTAQPAVDFQPPVAGQRQAAVAKPRPQRRVRDGVLTENGAGHPSRHRAGVRQGWTTSAPS